jgi:hypothetical protein
MKSPKPKKISSRSWQLIIPLDFPYLEIAAKIRLVAKNYYFIRHDRDMDDFGVPKKEHYHFLFTFSNARDLSTVKNYFSEFVKEDGEPWLLDNSFEKIVSIVGSKKYLCHFEHPGKAQYDWADVETNDVLFKDLFQLPLSKYDEFDYYVKLLTESRETVTLSEFIYKFKVRFVALNSHNMFNNILSLIKYYKEHKSDFVKDDGFVPVAPVPYESIERRREQAMEKAREAAKDFLPF